MTALRPRYFAIVASMRTGSNLLQRTLAQYPDILCHGELFNPAFIGRPGVTRFADRTLRERDADPVALIERMIEEAAGRIAGFRIFDDHDRRVLDHVATDPACARVLLARDPVESFVSLLIARETGQWMLTDRTRRKSAKVNFDPPAYEAYRDARAAARARFERRMQRAGATAFSLGYEDLKDTALINGLARHLGSSHRLQHIVPTLQRQNPGPVTAHLRNPAALSGLQAAPRSPRTHPGLRDAILNEAAGVLFLPIPGGPNDAVATWLKTLGSGTASHGASLAPPARRLVDAGLRSGAIRAAVTATRHPMARIYDVFMRKFVRPCGQGFPRIRMELIRHHGLALPDATLDNALNHSALAAAGYDLAAHRAAFKAFLAFLHENLAGRTLIRVDPLWAPQIVPLAAISAWLPMRYVLGPCAGAKAAALRAELGLSEGDDALLDAQPAPDPLFALSTVWTPALARQCAALYPDDHRQLGYDPMRCPEG